MKRETRKDAQMAIRKARMPPNETPREPIVDACSESRSQPGHQRSQEPEKAEHQVQPNQDGEKLQHHRAASLEEFAVQADNPQRGERLHLESNHDQPLENPDDRIKQRRYVNVPQENHPDEVTQIDVSKDVRERRHR